MHLIPTILCGGEGARLWPVSRELHPKPFIRLEDGYSLLQKTFLHAAKLPTVKEILTVTNRELFFKIEDEFRDINSSNLHTSFILEPFKRNTAAAIASAALQIEKTQGSESLMLVLGAVYLIENQDSFQQVIAKASVPAKEGKLVLLGLKSAEINCQPQSMEWDCNEVLATNNGLSGVLDQFDSTDLSSIQHSGIFLFKTGTILDFMEEYCPIILSTLRACTEESQTVVGKGFTRLDLDPNGFSEVPEMKIEDVLLEKPEQLTLLSPPLHWTSVASWNFLGKLLEPDANQNRVEGETLLHDVKNCYVKAESRLVGAVGIEDLIVIDTPDALLVASKQKANDIEQVYGQLKTQDHDTHKLHRTVYRPWGSYTILEESTRFKIKRIKVKPGASLSLQMHHHRSEHWIVVQGMAKVVNGEKDFYVNTNESTYIPAGHKHRLENPGVMDLVMIEVQSGEYLGEDDIVRFQDIYGRV